MPQNTSRRILKEAAIKKEGRERGRFQILRGRFQILRGRFQILRGRFQILRGRFQILRGRFQVAPLVHQRAGQLTPTQEAHEPPV